LGSITAKRSRWLFWLTLLFVALALLQLGLVNNTLGSTTFLPLLVLGGCLGCTAYFLHVRQPPADPILLPLVYFLSGLGLILIARLAPAFVSRQLLWLTLATALLLLVTQLPQNLNWLQQDKYTWLIGGLLLLGSTLIFGVNPSGFGARLWLPVGSFYFQPSELLKFLLIVFLAAYLADRRHQLIQARAYIGRLPIPHPSYWGPMLLMWGFSIVLLIWQRDLGAALLFFGTFLGMVYAATGQARYVFGGLLLLGLAGLLGYTLFDVVRLRVEAFLNPWLDPSGRSFQIVQSLLAFASGGILGQGLGQGVPTAIPVVHTDFVYAALGEEYGLLGAVAVLACFALLVERAFYIAVRAGNDFERLLALGIGTMLGLQTIVITAGTLKLMPLTGVTLPFVSYGGSSLIVSFLMIGLLLFVANNNRSQQQAHRPQPALRAVTLFRALLVAFLIVAGGLILWQVAAVPFLVGRSDNPRLVIEEQKIDRGRLLTRDGIPIAETLIDQNGLARRHYPYPGLSSVTGYYSLRYGVGGVEATFDPLLRGTVNRTASADFVDSLLHRPLVGQDVTLTIDLPAQVAADVMLGDQEGAVVVIEIETGAVLVMSSHPTYDPNKLDTQWDSLRLDTRAPLLNRTTQGLFPVGDLARLIGLIGLHEAGATIPAGPLATPANTLLGPLGTTGYAATAEQLGLTRLLPGLPSQPGRLPNFDDRGTVRDLAVTPLHLARVMAGLALDGQLPAPILARADESNTIQAFRVETAQAVRSRLPQISEQVIGLEGQASPQETGQRWLSWFVGLAPAQAATPPEQSSVALSDQGLILDPTKIATPGPTPAPAATIEKARYAVVAVVVTDTPQENPALRVASAPLKVLIAQE